MSGGTARTASHRRHALFARLLRGWLLLALLLGGLGTPWWTQAGTPSAADGASAHGCHEQPAPPAAPVPPHRHGEDCRGALCDCGCVLPPLLIPALPALAAAESRRIIATRSATGIAVALPGAPFRPPIG